MSKESDYHELHQRLGEALRDHASVDAIDHIGWQCAQARRACGIPDDEIRGRPQPDDERGAELSDRADWAQARLDDPGYRGVF